MGRRRRDLRITLGRFEAFFRKRRRIVKMDQVVRDTRMVRLPLPDLLEDGRALQLVGVCLSVGAAAAFQSPRSNT